jgi:hypothetical protein
MRRAPISVQGRSKEQALAANDRQVRRRRSPADPLFIGSDHRRRIAETPRVHFASRRSPVRSRLAPCHEQPGNARLLGVREKWVRLKRTAKLVPPAAPLD